MVLRLGYKASAEQFAPAELLDYSVHAERVGFDSVGVISAAALLVSVFGLGGNTFALAVELFAAGFVADFVELAPIDAVLLSAAELTVDASVTAASFASGLSVSTFAATVSVAAVVGAGEFAAGTGAGVCFAVIAEFDFTSITRR